MITVPNKDLSWTPIEFGDVYCSTACGFGCKRAAYDRAVLEADVLAKKLGAGWAPKVWENCGWNYEAVKGAAKVSPRRRPHGALTGDWSVVGYTCYLHTDKQRIADAKTPKRAVDLAITKALEGLQKTLEDIERIEQI